MKSIKDLLIDSDSSKQSAHRYGFIYEMLFSLLSQRKGDKLNVLEIGVSIYGNGSLYAWQRSDHVKRCVGLDKRSYTGDLNDKAVFYEMDAYTDETINHLREVEGDIFDIIIHDGIAETGPQLWFLENYDVLLAEGGFLVCEDVSALRVINKYVKDDTAFLIDGWGNIGRQLRSYNGDPGFYNHLERLLIKSKSEKISEVKTHEYKKHIMRLPDDTVFPEYERNSTELAVTVPLFYSEKDTQYEPFNAERFQNVHCKGAVWAGMSLIHNSDLADKGVPLYFHIEDRAWEYALPVFEQYQIPKKWLRKITVPTATLDYKVNKTQFGKTFLSLLDDELDPDVLLVLDSDIFTLATNAKHEFYDKLTSTLLKTHPAMTYFKMREMDYSWWVGMVLIASGVPHTLMQKEKDLNKLEQMAYKRLGFDKDARSIDRDAKVQRFYAENYMQTFPKGHAIKNWTIEKMSTCYTAPYLHAVWAEYNQPFWELSTILGLPIYDWENDFIQAKQGYDCFAHMRVKKSETGSFPSKVNQYYDVFYENITRHILKGGEK